MNLLNTLERKFGKYAIKQLIVYIVGINVLIYVMKIGMPESDAISKLLLDPQLILQGEVWRLITWVFIPPSASLLWIVFILYFYYMIGSGLEQEWGSFRFNIYYFTGVAATALADRDVLLIGGWDDFNVMIDHHVLPLYGALVEAKAQKVHIAAFQDDHAFEKSGEELAATVIHWIKSS